jgi:hypothetical protein
VGVDTDEVREDVMGDQLEDKSKAGTPDGLAAQRTAAARAERDALPERSSRMANFAER